MSGITLGSLRTGGGKKKPIAIAYGKAGIGKTTFAACAPSPIFIQTEDGLTSPQLHWVPSFGVAQSYEQVLESFGVIFQHAKEQGWETVVIDSIDRLAPLITTYVCQQNGWKKLEDGAYGRGKVAYIDEWRNFMTMCLSLRNEADLGIIMLGHCKAAKISPPDAEPYTQYALTLQEDAARILVGDADMVLFFTYPITTISAESAGFNKKATRAVADKPRIFTQERGAHVAKNRYSMPEFLPMEWARVAEYVPAWKARLPQSAAPAAETAA